MGREKICFFTKQESVYYFFLAIKKLTNQPLKNNDPRLNCVFSIAVKEYSKIGQCCKLLHLPALATAAHASLPLPNPLWTEQNRSQLEIRLCGSSLQDKGNGNQDSMGGWWGEAR